TAGNLQMVAWNQRDRYADQNDNPAYRLGDGKRAAQAQPFNHGRNRSGEAKHHQHGEPGSNARQGLEKGQVPYSETDATAQEEDWEALARQPPAKAVAPNATDTASTADT